MPNVTEFFGTNVFNESVMKERLPAETFELFKGPYITTKGST